MVIEITEEQLFDYMNCPVRYAIKYGKNHIKVPPQVTFPKLLNQVVYGFCQSLKDGIVLPPDKIKRKWDTVCKNHPDKITQDKIREGFGALYRFYEYAEENQILVADIGSPYILRVKDGDDTYIYNGTLGIILSNKDGEPENFKTDFSSRFPEQSKLDMNLKTTLDHVGFYELYNLPLSGTRVHHVKKSRDFYTTRDIPSSTKRVRTIIANVCKSIRHNIWYPHETPLCSSCEVRDFCMMYGS